MWRCSGVVPHYTTPYTTHHTTTHSTHCTTLHYTTPHYTTPLHRHNTQHYTMWCIHKVWPYEFAIPQLMGVIPPHQAGKGGGVIPFLLSVYGGCVGGGCSVLLPLITMVPMCKWDETKQGTLHCTHTTLHYTTQRHTTLHNATLPIQHNTTQQLKLLHHTTLHHTTLHCTLHYTTVVVFGFFRIHMITGWCPSHGLLCLFCLAATGAHQTSRYPNLVLPYTTPHYTAPHYTALHHTTEVRTTPEYTALRATLHS